MLALSRRFASHARFASRNRLALSAVTALEQAGGMLVNPIAIVALCSLLTSDLSRMVVPAIAAHAGWVAGYAAIPALLSRARRRLPWTIGASIVRAASLALLTYVVAADDVARDDRLRSITICVAAYAVAAGLSRGASESLAPRVVASRRRGRSDAVGTLVPASLALVVGLGSFTLLVDVARSPLTRLATLFGMAAALSGAAVLALGWVVEAPNLTMAARRRPPTPPGLRRQLLPAAWMLVSAALAAVELLLLVGLVRSLEAPRAYLLSGIGAVLLSSALASVVLGPLLPALRPRALMQLSAVLSSLAFALAIALPTLLAAEEAPRRLLGRAPQEVGIWGAMALVGVAHQVRRRILPGLVERAGASPALMNTAGFILAFLPLPVALIFERWEVRSWLLTGLAVGILGIALSGLVSTRRSGHRAERTLAGRRAPVRPVGAIGGRTVT